MHTETKQALLKAKGLIVKGWCKGAYARDSNGYSLHWEASAAVEYCAVGALKTQPHLISLLNQHLPPEFVGAVRSGNINFTPSRWSEEQARVQLYNDHTTTIKEDILDLFDRVINQLEIEST